MSLWTAKAFEIIMGIFDFLSGSSSRGKSTNPMADMYRGLIDPQKYSIMGVLFFFQGFSLGNANANEANKMVYFMASALEVGIPEAMDFVERRLNTGDKLIRGLQTIKDRAVLDSVLYNCFGLAKISHKDEAFAAMIELFKEVGYTENEMFNTVQKIEALGNMFNR